MIFWVRPAFIALEKMLICYQHKLLQYLVEPSAQTAVGSGVTEISNNYYIFKFICSTCDWVLDIPMLFYYALPSDGDCWFKTVVRGGLVNCFIAAAVSLVKRMLRLHDCLPNAAGRFDLDDEYLILVGLIYYIARNCAFNPNTIQLHSWFVLFICKLGVGLCLQCPAFNLLL